MGRLLSRGRDAVFRLRIPATAPRFSRIGFACESVAFDFLVARAGDGSVSQLLQLLREGASPLSAYLSATGLSAAEFDQQFELYVRSRFIA